MKREGRGNSCLMGVWFSFWGDENVLVPDRGGWLHSTVDVLNATGRLLLCYIHFTSIKKQTKQKINIHGMSWWYKKQNLEKQWLTQASRQMPLDTSSHAQSEEFTTQWTKERTPPSTLAETLRPHVSLQTPLSIIPGQSCFEIWNHYLTMTAVCFSLGTVYGIKTGPAFFADHSLPSLTLSHHQTTSFGYIRDLFRMLVMPTFMSDFSGGCRPWRVSVGASGLVQGK